MTSLLIWFEDTTRNEGAMLPTVSTRLLHAATVILAFAALTWFGCPVFFDAMVPLASVPWPPSIPSLPASVAALVAASVVLSAPGVYRGLLAQEAKNLNIFWRSLTITGQLPCAPAEHPEGGDW